MPYDWVLFDLDGTISDPLEGIGKSINHALAHHGFEQLGMAAQAGLIGPPLDVSFRSITGSDDPELIQSLVDRYRERYIETGYRENELYEGIEDSLRCLRDMGRKMAVCTSKRQDYAKKILVMFGLDDYFEFVSGGDVGVHKTQQLAGLLDSGRISGQAVLVGDRHFDMVAAHSNGLHAAGVLWGYGPLDELSAEQPRYLVETTADLLTAVRSW